MRHRGCIGFKENGEACRAPKLQEGDYCFWHSPEHAEEVSEARRLGGLRRRREVASRAGCCSTGGARRLADIPNLSLNQRQAFGRGLPFVLVPPVYY